MRHGEAGCEQEVFAAIAAIGRIAADAGQPMSLLSVSWVLHQPSVACALVGARKPEQIAQLALAADLQLSQPVLQQLDQATQVIKQTLGPNPDMWMSESRFR